jgi:cytochrome c oxidase cbb3-type subunit 3
MTRVAAAVLLILVACRREERHYAVAPSNDTYTESAWDISEGETLYNAFNCVGCHSHGGGGMGPPLMDTRWAYGSTPAQVYASISEGRPNGMPAFKDKIAPADLRKLVAYVRTLASLTPKDSRPSRDDHLSVAPPPSLAAQHPEEP